MQNHGVALVSGANRGIGLATATALARANFTTYLAGRDQSQTQQAVATLAEQGLRVKALVLDVTDPASIQRAKKLVLDQEQRLDVLINNAGVYLDEGKALKNLDLSILEATLQVNFWGALQLCQAFLPSMDRQGYGRIVNVSSGLGQIGDMGAGTGAYRLSKLLLNGMTRILAAESDPAKVKINSVCPGWVATRMGGAGAPRSPEEAAQGVLWATCLPADGPTGGFFRDGRPLDW